MAIDPNKYATIPGSVNGYYQDNATGKIVRLDPNTGQEITAGASGILDSGTPSSDTGLPSTADVIANINTMFSNLTNDIAASTLPQDRQNLIQDQEAKRLALIRSNINQKYATYETGLRDTEALREGGINASSGQAGGTGSGLGESTIRAASIALTMRETEKAIKEAMRERDTALATADQDSFDRATQRIKDEQAALDKTRQAERQYRLDVLGKALDINKQKIDQEQYASTQARLERTQALAETQFNYNVSQDEIKTMNDNLLNMAKGGIPLAKIPEVDRTAFEKATGMVPGTFEAVYTRLVYDALQGNTKDALELEDLKARIANEYSLIADRNTTATNNKIIQKLSLTSGTDGYVSPSAYALERSQSKMKPGEFDLRYGYLLSPQERTNLNVYQNVSRDTNGTDNSSLAQ